MAADQLRQIKNTFVVTTTLVSRATVRGGMDTEDAFSLSDAYIQKCELLVLEVTRYVQHHLSEPISAEDIAKRLYLSRPISLRSSKRRPG